VELRTMFQEGFEGTTSPEADGEMNALLREKICTPQRIVRDSPGSDFSICQTIQKSFELSQIGIVGIRSVVHNQL